MLDKKEYGKSPRQAPQQPSTTTDTSIVSNTDTQKNQNDAKSNKFRINHFSGNATNYQASTQNSSITVDSKMAGKQSQDGNN